MNGQHKIAAKNMACGVLGLLMLLMAAALCSAKEVPDIGPCGKPPPPKPAQASGAESMPPLPLPATPQRRTEKKNPPRPPVIVVKIRTQFEHDWDTDPNDINNLLIWMKSTLGVNFTWEAKTIEQLNLESGEVPVLYRTGHHAFHFTPQERQRIRNYVLRGGMIIFDACCGRKEFADSARAEIKAMFPDYPLKPIPMDHPVFNCYYQNAGLVRFTPATLKNFPDLRSPGPSGIEGIEVRCRMAVVFTPHDMSCGWDLHTHSTPGGSWIESDDALKIGANLMAYATATRNMTVTAADAKSYVDATKTRTDKFRVGQIVHAGDWNPDPVGLRNLLDTVGQTTSLKVSFDTVPIHATPAELTRCPFIYMTGHDDFHWSDDEVAALRQYLANGGFLFADACCGREKFDLAFRREVAKVLGNGNTKTGGLQPIPLNHPIYSIQNHITTVQLTQAANFRAQGQATNLPKLEYGALNGRMVVVYSPLSLNTGWRLHKVPYAVGYAPKSALEIGVNVVLYAMAQ